MSEMLYGNTGRRDESFNIDMKQPLYLKLQGEAVIPLFKSLIGDNCQGNGENFVFLGDVQCEEEKVCVMGYNTNLENGNRAGGYSHYIAFPQDAKKTTAFFEKARFLTKEGYTEYLSKKAVTGAKRFVIEAKEVPIDIDAKKRLVNNVLEMFMKKSKRKAVTFSFEVLSAEEFSAKSLFVLTEIMKYLPFQMRKNISFASYVNSNQELPENLNLGAYCGRNISVAPECISIDDVTKFTEGEFFEFVEKVFAMADHEREEYFEILHKELEIPLLKQSEAEVKSDVYLVDIEKKTLWSSGVAEKAIDDIYKSVEDVLKVYPVYLAMAKERLLGEGDTTVDYLNKTILATKNIEEFKAVYTRIHTLFLLCSFKFDDIMRVMSKHATESFLKPEQDSKDIIRSIDELKAINPELLDEDIILGCIEHSLKNKKTLEDVFEQYIAFKEKNYVDSELLEEKVEEVLELLIVRATELFSDSKQKLQEMQRIFDNFKNTYSTMDYSTVQRVFEVFVQEFFDGVCDENVRADFGMLYQLDSKLSSINDVGDIIECLGQISDISCDADETAKQKTSNEYRTISQKMIVYLQNRILSYEELITLLEGVKESVAKLEGMGIYDGEPVIVGEDDERIVVPDGMQRFLYIFDMLLTGINSAPNLYDAMKSYDDVRKELLDNCEIGLREVFKNQGTVVLKNILAENPEWCEQKNIEEVIRKLVKEDAVKVSTISALKKCGKEIPSNGNKNFVVFAIFNLMVIMAAVILVFAGLWMLSNDGGSENIGPEVVHIMKTDTEIKVENYLRSFDYQDDEYDSAKLFVGRIAEDEETDDLWKITVVNDCVNPEFSGKEISAKYEPLPGRSREYYNIKKAETEENYIVVTRLGDDSIYRIIDIFALPENFGENYDFEKDFNAEVHKNPTEKEFIKNIISYVGYKCGYLNIEESTDGE